MIGFIVKLVFRDFYRENMSKKLNSVFYCESGRGNGHRQLKEWKKSNGQVKN